MKSIFKLTLLYLVTVITLSGTIILFAGDTSNNSDPSSTSYTLNDIYNLTQNVSTTSHTLSPTSPVEQSTMYSVSEIYVALANLIQADKLASSSVTYLGVTGGEDTPAEVTTIPKEFSPTSEAGSITGFTLQDIANLIDNTRVTTTVHSSFAPTSGPADSGPTLDEIYNSLSTLIAPENIATGTVYLGVVGTYEEIPGDICDITIQVVGTVCSDGSIYVAPGFRTTTTSAPPMAWNDAITYCLGLNGVNQGDGWQLPTLDDLIMLWGNSDVYCINYNEEMSCVDDPPLSGPISGFVRDSHFSSTEDFGGENAVWGWDFLAGTGPFSYSKSGNSNFRCVRRY